MVSYLVFLILFDSYFCQMIAQNSCIFPKKPEHGEVHIFGYTSSAFKEGDSIAEGSVLIVTCSTNYKPTVNYIPCINGQFTNAKIECESLCEPLEPKAPLDVKCENKLGRQLHNCLEPTEGTKAIFSCSEFYREPKNPVSYCIGGQWNRSMPFCELECGAKQIRLKPTVIGGKVASQNIYPWMAALYWRVKNKIEFRCGGSLVSPKAVVTAAHCVTDDVNGNPYPHNIFSVIMGKFYVDYADTRDMNQQKSEVAKIIINDRYAAHFGNYQYDVALVIVETPFRFTKDVQIICLNRNPYPIYSVNPNGILTGWGMTFNGSSQPSDVLKEIELPFVDINTCTTNLPYEYKRFLYRSDKLCAGFLNKGIGACIGDAGGGLVFKNVDGLYYLEGILSILIGYKNTCDQNYYSMYTKVSDYLDFIDRNVELYGTTISTSQSGGPSIPVSPLPTKSVLVYTNISVANPVFPVGGDVELPCLAGGNPNPEVRWYKDGVEIIPNERQTISANNSLFVREATQADSGMYQCEATNTFSRAASTAQINIQGEK